MASEIGDTRVTNILQFRKPPHVVLNGGIISCGPDAGQPIYVLDYVSEEGERMGVWDGATYSDACRAAEFWRQDGVRVIDLVQEAS